MNGFSRLFGFFLITAMVATLGGVFLFEKKLAEHDLVDTVSPFLAPPLNAGTSTRTSFAQESATTTHTETPTSSLKSIGGTTVKNNTARHTLPKQPVKRVTIAPVVSLSGPLVVENLASTTPTSSVAHSSTTESIPLQSGALNQPDIIALTNKERIAVGLPALSFNAQLSTMASAKAKDMIQKQYFAHISPDGTDLTKLAKTYGYRYLNVGENLALGDFTSSIDVVSGWMHSPGHRANILNKNFTEIGVSAILGNYEGRDVWYAVQEFGRPLSDCPSPDALLKEKIETSQTAINAFQVSLSNLQAEINAANLDQATYNAKIKDYNAIIELYNQAVTTVKQDIQTYNSEVEAYNTCAGA